VLVNIAAIIAPLFLCAGIGFVWGRLKRPYNTEMITGLAQTLGLPALIFSTLTQLRVSPAAFGEMAGVYSLALLTMLVVSAVILRVVGLDQRSYLPALTFPNSGNMGLPVCLFAFGEAGLAFGTTIFVIAASSGLIVGAGVASGKFTFRDVVRNPLYYAIAASFAFMFTGARPPAWVANTTFLLGGLAVPLMIISLGVAISRIQVTSLGRSAVLGLVRLVIGVGVGSAIATAFGLDGVARGVLIIQCAMPVAVHNYLFAQRYQRRPDEVAGMVVISTAASFATLPLLLLYVLPSG
jgi:predicted permease